MKKIILTLTAVLALTNSAIAGEGNEGGGGGDPCEDRIKVISSDIANWINKGGSSALLLPSGVSRDTYDRNMLHHISKSKVQCVAPGDKGYPVNVNGTAKTCRFDRKGSDSRITCDLSKFQSLSETDQYVLIHHEYAGLSQIENPEGDDSNYFVSNQISAYLVDTIVKRLAVKSSTPTQPADEMDLSAWHKVTDGSDDDVRLALRQVVRYAQWSDCEVTIKDFPEQNLVVARYQPHDSTIKPFVNIPVGYNLSTVLRKNSQPRFIRQVTLDVREDSDTHEKKLAIDSIFELDQSETKLISIKITKSEYMKFNIGTVNKPKWTTRFIPIRSLVCHTK